jgi:Ca2+-binding EF-hand superfamily protein
MRRSLLLPKPGRSRPGFFVCVCCAALLPAVAFAQRVDATTEYLARMDGDHDGRVSLDEYQDWMRYAFDAMDRDHDDVLSTAELPGGKGKPVTRADYRARIAATFNKQDANRDGRLDARELASPPQ